MMLIKKLASSMIIVFVMTAGNAQAGGDAAAGETKSAACAGCHGEDGKGVDPNPPLAGMEEGYFVEQLEAYKSGAREHALMKMFSDQLSDQDMADMAAYYATLGIN